MPDLDFRVTGVEMERHAMVPTLRFVIAVTDSTDTAVENVALQCQIRIEPTRRTYRDGEHERLRDLFGDRSRWGETLRSFLWVLVPASVPAFAGGAAFNLLVPCSFDFNVAATKYFHGLKEGDVPLTLLFSGSVFYRAPDGQLQIEQIPWTKNANYRLPVPVWQTMMEQYYPDCAWLQLGRGTFEKLYSLKQRSGAPTLEHTLERLLECAGAAS